MADPSDTLDGLQRRALKLLADVRPRWVLVGGAALAGVYFHHRSTRDLDLFWRGRAHVGDLAEECARRLRADGLEVVTLQTADAFHRLRVQGGGEVIVVDLVAEPTQSLEAPAERTIGGSLVHVASLHDLLVDKLCALLGRSEIRDLVDVRVLLTAGGDLPRALGDAPRRDAGFSPLTLAWVLRGLPVASLASAAGRAEGERAALERFRDDLVLRLAGA